MAGAISGPRCRSIIPVAVGWYRQRASGHGACRTEGREGDSASRYSQNSQNMPGVLDRPNCANTANNSTPPPDRWERGRWPASPPTGPGLPPSRALGPARSRASPGGSAGHRPPSRCGNQAGRGVQAMVSPRRHTARGSLRNPGAIPRSMASTGRATKTTSSGGSRRHAKGIRHRGSNAADQRSVVGRMALA